MALVAPSPTSVRRASHFSRFQETSNISVNNSHASPSFISPVFSTVSSSPDSVGQQISGSVIEAVDRASQPSAPFSAYFTFGPIINDAPVTLADIDSGLISLLVKDQPLIEIHTTSPPQRPSGPPPAAAHRSARSSITSSSTATTANPRTSRAVAVSASTHSTRSAGQKLPTKAPPTQRNASNSLQRQQHPCATCTEAKAEASSNKKQLDRALARVASLEKTIEYLQVQHSTALKGLHIEIARLQNICSDKAFKKVVLSEDYTGKAKGTEEEDRVDSQDFAEDFRLPTTPQSYSSSTVQNINEYLVDDTVMPKKIVSEPFDIQTLHDDITSMGDGDGDGDGVEVDEGTDVVLSLDSSSTKPHIAVDAQKRKRVRSKSKTNGRGTSKECVNRSSDDAGKELVLEAGDISEADTAKGEEAKPKALISNNSDDPPYHLILHQQKRKYQTFIERLNSDNKRKQKEIESLRSELELIRDVLAVSGLDIDLVELKALVMARPSGGARVNPAEALASRAKKLNILPPIGAIKLGHDGEDVGTIQDMEEAAKIVSTIVLDRKPAPLSDLLQHRKGAGAYSSATNALEAVSRSLALGGTVNEAGPSSIEPMHFVRSPHPSNSLDSSSVDGLASPIPPTTKTTKSIRAPTKTKPTSDSDNISAKLRSHRYRHRVTRADQPGDEAGGGHTLDDPTVAYTTNGNLDYQGRARTLKLIAMSNGAPDEDVASGKTLLPPLPSMGTADPAGVLPQVGKKAMKSKIGSVGGVTSNGNVTGSGPVVAASTAWSKRVLGAKAVRQRQWKEREESGKL